MAALLPCEETEIARRERRAFLIMLASMEAGRLVSLALTSHIPWSLFLPTAASPLSFYFIPPATLLQLTAGETTVPAAPAWKHRRQVRPRVQWRAGASSRVGPACRCPGTTGRWGTSPCNNTSRPASITTDVNTRACRRTRPK